MDSKMYSEITAWGQLWQSNVCPHGGIRAIWELVNLPLFPKVKKQDKKHNKKKQTPKLSSLICHKCWEEQELLGSTQKDFIFKYGNCVT